MQRLSRTGVLLLSILLAPPAWGFIHESVRIRALGSEFNGLIPDPYTDVFRNPAFLANWGKGALTAEVLDAEKSIYGGNLALSLKYFKFGISYKAHGHPEGFIPADGRNFSGQRVASDLANFSVSSGLKKFEVVKAVLSRPLGSLNLGIDLQYLRDWVFGPGFPASTPPFFNQLPTALQLRGGAIYALSSRWKLDGTIRYQRNRPRLEASFIGFISSSERDSNRTVFFDTRTTFNANSSGPMDEMGIFISSRVMFAKDFEGAVVLSAERLKGDLPVIIGGGGTDTVSFFSGPTYTRSFSSLIDSSLQHFRWKYRAGFSLSKTSQSQTRMFGGMVITVTRTREFFNVRVDSNIQFTRNGQLWQNRQTILTSSGEKNGLQLTELAIPTAAEFKPKNYLSVRIGLKPVLIIDNPDKGGHHGDLNTFYSAGLGVEVDKHIVVDAFAQKDLGNLQNWQIALRYLF